MYLGGEGVNPQTFEEWWAENGAGMDEPFARKVWDAAMGVNSHLIMAMGYRMAWQAELLSIMARKRAAEEA